MFVDFCMDRAIGLGCMLEIFQGDRILFSAVGEKPFLFMVVFGTAMKDAKRRQCLKLDRPTGGRNLKLIKTAMPRPCPP